MVWATVSSWSCFCWLYRVSPSLAAKNIINLISVLTIWWCPCVKSSLVLLEEGFAMTSAFFWQNSVSLCPASFCTPRPNLPVIPVSFDFLLLHFNFLLTNSYSTQKECYGNLASFFIFYFLSWFFCLFQNYVYSSFKPCIYPNVNVLFPAANNNNRHCYF